MTKLKRCKGLGLAIGQNCDDAKARETVQEKRKGFRPSDGKSPTGKRKFSNLGKRGKKSQRSVRNVGGNEGGPKKERGKLKL